MDFFDVIKKFRTGRPDIHKTGKAMNILAWVCILGGVWNAVVPHLFPFNQTPFNLPPAFPYLSLALGLSLGYLFFLSSKAIRKKEPQGRRMAQVGVMMLGLVIGGLSF